MVGKRGGDGVVCLQGWHWDRMVWSFVAVEFALARYLSFLTSLMLLLACWLHASSLSVASPLRSSSAPFSFAASLLTFLSPSAFARHLLYRLRPELLFPLHLSDLDSSWSCHHTHQSFCHSPAAKAPCASQSVAVDPSANPATLSFGSRAVLPTIAVVGRQMLILDGRNDGCVYAHDRILG